MNSIRALLPGVLEVDDVKTHVACTVLMEIGSIQFSREMTYFTLKAPRGKTVYSCLRSLASSSIFWWVTWDRRSATVLSENETRGSKISRKEFATIALTMMSKAVISK